MKIILLILSAIVFAYCKPAKHVPARVKAYSHYRKGGSLTIRLDSLGVIDSNTARFVEAIRHRLNIDSNNIKYEIRHSQH
jgi:hypothetical protein